MLEKEGRKEGGVSGGGGEKANLTTKAMLLRSRSAASEVTKARRGNSVENNLHSSPR